MRPYTKMMMVNAARGRDDMRYRDMEPRGNDYRDTESRGNEYRGVSYRGGESPVRIHEGDDSRMSRYDTRGGYETEARFRDRRGREHYDDGRYAPRSAYDDNRAGGREDMNLIGFDRGQDFYPDDGRIEFGGDRMRATYEPPYMNEMEHRSSPKVHGHASHHEDSFTPETAMKWVRGMQREDGGTGEKFKLEEVRGLMRQKGVTKDVYRVWAAMNALYSDLCKVNEKHGITSKDYYFDAACAFFLDDRDAEGDKMMTYYECIVKK